MKFKINNLEWSIDYLGENDKKLNGTDWITFGLTECVTQTITIRTGMSERLTRETVIHELCHAFLFSTGNQGSDGYTSEQLCNFFGSWADEIMKIADAFLNEAPDKN